MPYEIFRRPSTRVKTPTVAITTDGRIALNAAAGRVLVEAGVGSVLLLWDKTSHRIALKAASKADKNAYAVTIPANKHAGSLKAKCFLSHIGWNATQRETLLATWNKKERMLEAALPGHSMVSKIAPKELASKPGIPPDLSWAANWQVVAAKLWNSHLEPLRSFISPAIGGIRKLLVIAVQVGLLALINVAGRFLEHRFSLRMPGNLIGMLLLFALLSSRIIPLTWVQEAASLLTRHFAFFFIPFAVGLIAFKQVFLQHGWPILGTLIVSAVCGMLLCSFFAQLTNRQEAKNHEIATANNRHWYHRIGLHPQPGGR